MTPTKPGLKGKKFHLVEAASNTSRASIPVLLKIFESSFTKAILISRCEFSITFEASATFIEGAKCVPAIITEAYTSYQNQQFHIL